jgi:hypothetical protein
MPGLKPSSLGLQLLPRATTEPPKDQNTKTEAPLRFLHISQRLNPSPNTPPVQVIENFLLGFFIYEMWHHRVFLKIK